LDIALNIEEVSDNYTHARHSKYMTDSAPEKKLPDPGTTAWKKSVINYGMIELYIGGFESERLKNFAISERERETHYL